MTQSSKQTTKMNSFSRNLLIFVFVCTVAIHGAGGQCQLPRSMRGRWKEPLKGMLTFTNESVSGFDIHVFGELTLSCVLQNSSVFYVMESTPFSLFGLNFTAFTCWSFDKQSSDLVHLYEHTDKNQQAGDERVKMYMPSTAFAFDSVCSNTNTSALTYRLLHKQRRKSRKNKTDQTGILVAIIVLLVVISLVALVTYMLIRRRKSRGMFKINDKRAGSRDKASAYRVNEPENQATPPAHSSSKNTTTTTITTSGHNEPRRNPTNPIIQAGKPFTEDNTSEDAYSPSSVSVTATSLFTSVSANSSSSASSSVYASGSASGLTNQDGNNPMTPICGSKDKEDKQLGFSDQFVPVQFSSSQGATVEDGAVASSGTVGS